MAKTTVNKWNITIHLTKRVATNEGGRTFISWVPDGTLSGDIVLAIDEAKLAKLMGPRALRSKSKKSTLAGGAIVARATNLVRQP